MSQWLPFLLVLVCPLTMGAMMWLMMHGQQGAQRPNPSIAKLESQIQELRSAVQHNGSADPKGSGPSSVTADRGLSE